MRSVVILSILAASLTVGCAGAKNLASAAGVDAKDVKQAQDVAADATQKAADDAPKNIFQTAAYNKMPTLVAALSHAGLDKVLEGPGPFTVFAPTEEAFAKIPAETRAMLMSDAGKEKLKAILTYHVVSGAVTSADVAKMKTAKTVNGADVAIASGKDGKVTVGGATVVHADVGATNGVIHVVDTVLMPPGA